MPRGESPASSLRSQDTAQRPPSGANKPAYRLFPSVEPTPPASPISLQHKAKLSRASEYSRRRSSSLDDGARRTAGQQNHGARKVDTGGSRRDGRAGTTDLKPPMSTVQEQPQESPTVPSRFALNSRTKTLESEEPFHGRSSSAPDECAANPEFSPIESPTAASSQALHGLGLTMPIVANDQPAGTLAKRAPKQKPNLRVFIRSRKEQPDQPPPPPPKSPRHSRSASGHSRTSSSVSHFSTRPSSRASTTRPGSPIAIAQSAVFTSVKPTFVTHVRDSSNPREQAPGKRKADARVQDVMGATVAENGKTKEATSRKPMPQLPQQATSDVKTEEVLPVPSSRFTAASPTSAEGERTPRAAAHTPGYPSSESAALEPAHVSQARRPPFPEPEHAPPPTPRKDSFLHIMKGSKEFGKQPPRTPLKDTYTVPPKPTEMPRPATMETAVHKSETQAKSEPPRRELPKRPSGSDHLGPPVARSLAPTPEVHSRSPTPEPGSRSSRDRPTPELPFRSATPDPTPNTPVDPEETLNSLSKQTEALHTRYASLRSERQKLSTSIVSSLREQKAEPDYVNTLLDRHLALAAINSSMDICFAKMKSLECRKEEAMTAVVAQQVAKRVMEKMKKTKSVSSSMDLSARSGRWTPDVEVEAGKTQRSVNERRKDSVRSESRPETTTWARPADERVKPSGRSPRTAEKRNTIIRTQLVRPTDSEGKIAESEEFNSPDLDEAPKKIRIKGAKAAKILGLMLEDVEAPPGSAGITLPDDMDSRLTPPVDVATRIRDKSPSLEVHIPSSPLRLSLLPPSPAPTTALPTPPYASALPPALPPKNDRKDTMDSQDSVAPGSMTCIATADSAPEARDRADSGADSSAPEEPEVVTPSEEQVHSPASFKSATTGQPETVQVHVDDDILDYYHSADEKWTSRERA